MVTICHEDFSRGFVTNLTGCCVTLDYVSTVTAASRMRQLVEELQAIEDRLRLGGGDKKIEKQHRDGKLTARERIAQLLDPGSMFVEIGLLVAYDQYDGQAPGAGVVTGFGKIEGRPAVIVANDATVKAGAWWPETIKKILRTQEIAMRNRAPIVYLVDSAGVNLPYQDGIFPGQYGAARIFYYNRGRGVSAGAERRYLHGGRDQLHGARRAESGEGRGGSGD
jgi:acetyl-CoA carboxylase carboxyltransferase component